MASEEPESTGVPMKEAFARAKSNSNGKMRRRGQDNRVEPECWPVVRPSFSFSKDQRFFTIGSCFAGNIGRRLELDGYNVHMNGIRRNRYTPAAIFQEIDWAGRIFRRDGVVSESDLEPLLMETAPGRFSDLWSRAENEGAVELDRALERRQLLYDYFSGAFTCDVVVITLGLIEAWHDSVTDSYVEIESGWLRRGDCDRFTFEVLPRSTSAKTSFAGRWTFCWMAKGAS